MIDTERITTMRRQITEETLAAFDFAINSPNPTASDLYRHVYAD
jgi:TPP-dependent pyruvate/acetoin dehydrogenase alpha subunit